MSSKSPRKIDVHHHFIPPIYLEALEARGGDPSGYPTPKWSVEASLDLMNKTGASTTILSLTAPGVQIVSAEDQPQLARSVNEYAAKLRDENSRFGFFAAVPSLFDSKAAIAEIAHALDVLKADGVTLFTRYGKGNAYLGNIAFRPVWEELNRRKAVVFVHPTHPVDTEMLHPYLPQPLIDYPHETARTVFDMISNDTKHDFPDCKIILPHAGGTLPILFMRGANGISMISRGKKTVEAILKEVRSFYYDLALSSSSNVLDTLLKHFPHDHILFGTDFPFAPAPQGVMFADLLDKYELSEETRAQITFRNAHSLFPRLAEEDSK